MGMSGTAEQAMMRCAKHIVKPAMQRIARIRTKRTADAVNIVKGTDGTIEVRAGRPEGPYGWTPIQALMFEENKRHPLFGHPPWYHQGDFPITALTMKLVQRQVEDEFVQEDIKLILGKHNL